MAKVVHINIDSRREIDQELKKVCGEFTADTFSKVVEPLNTFLIKFSTKKPSLSSPDGSTELTSQQINQAVTQFQEAVEERLPFTMKKLQEYINDTKMEQILLKTIQINVLDYYKTFYGTVTQGNPDTTVASVENMDDFISQIIHNTTL